MQITFNPASNNLKSISFGIENLDKNNLEYSKKYSDKTTKKKTDKTNTSPKGILAKLGYAWVNFSEGTKGIFKGIFYGVLTSAAFSTYKTLSSGIKKYKQKEIKFSEIFNYKKTLSKSAKVLTVFLGAAVFMANLVIATLKANQRSANVDHMLYDGHRS